MIGGISGTGSYFRMYQYGSVYGSRSARRAQNLALAEENPAASASGRVSLSSSAAANAKAPASGPAGCPSAPSKEAGTAVQGKGGAEAPGLFIRKGADPAEYAVRMRMQNLDPEASGTGFPGQEEAVAKGSGVGQEYDDGKCETCEKRKYQDGSNDMGVSFKTPTHVAPEAAASAVRSHEQEHVSREQAKAKREDRHVVSQSVTLHTSVCPECGRVYISGGVTRTTTAANKPKQDYGAGQPERRPFSAVA